MDIQFQTDMRDGFLAACADSNGNPEEANRCALVLSHQIRGDEAAARFHIPTLLRVANGSMPVPHANLILYECYLQGWGVELDQAAALRRLELAVQQGSEAAEWHLASRLLDNEKLSTVLARDPDRALTILRKLAREATDITVMIVARRTFSAHVANNFCIDNISWKDRELITWYANDTLQVIGMDHLHLALFFARGQSSENYAGPEYELSRKLLIKGSKSRDTKVREVCEAQLDAWGVRPVAEPEPTAAQKVVESIKLTAMLGGVAAILAFWSIVGLFLLSITAVISAVMLPVVLGGLAITFLIWWRRR